MDGIPGIGLDQKDEKGRQTMIVLLTESLLLLLFLEYRCFKKELCAAPILFTAPFVVLCAAALLSADAWNFRLHWNTFGVILVGNMCFFAGALLAQRLRLGTPGSDCRIIRDSKESWGKYALFLLLQGICYWWKLDLVLEFAISRGVDDGVSAALAYYDHITKFTTEETFQIPRILNIGLDICKAFGYVCACVLAQKLIQRKKTKNLVIVAMNFGLVVLGGLTSGGRGLAIRYLVAFLTAYLLLCFRRHRWNENLKPAQLLWVALGGAMVVVFFIISRQMVGRGQVTELTDYISKYLGAQLYNLDHYLNEAFRVSEFPGQETFQPLVQFLCRRFGIPAWADYRLDLPPVYELGFDFGNVYTTFYAYIHDFGYAGVVFMPLMCGFVAQLSYKLSRCSPTGHTIHLGLTVYSDMAYLCIFSFFSNKFGEQLFTFAMLEKIAYMWLIILFLFHFRVEGTVLRLELPRHLPQRKECDEN